MEEELPVCIGLGAMARVGKDVFAKMLKNLVEDAGDYCQIYPLAYELKKDMEKFISEKLGIDVWTDNTEEKAIFRPLLVGYGKVLREKSKGTHWTSIVEKKILCDFEEKKNSYKNLVYIIPDIRYCHYETDEVSWLKDRMKGRLVFIDRILSDGSLLGPANEEEETFAPKIKDISDFTIKWRNLSESEKLGKPSFHAKAIYNKLRFLKVIK